MSTEKPQSIHWKLAGGVIHGRRIGSGHPNKVLCLHGWLDNANSFAPLMPHIENTDMVAIDMAGHGLSDHQPGNFPYTIASHAQMALEVADALDWQEFHLVGHSLGGCIAPFCAIAAPEKIKSLVAIDAVGPMSEEAAQFPDRFKRHHNELNDPTRYRSRIYQTVDQAIEARLTANKMLPESARLIVERQLIDHEEGFKWRFDRKLRVASPVYYTESQVQEILKAIPCPVLFVLATDGYVLSNDKTATRLAQVNNKTVRELAGNHHLHMDTPAPVAREIKKFMANCA